MPPIGGINAGPQCLRPEDCPREQLCINNLCVDRGGAGDPCLNDRECGSGFICDDASQMCSEGCRSDRDCANGQTCNRQTNLCQATP